MKSRRKPTTDITGWKTSVSGWCHCWHQSTVEKETVSAERSTQPHLWRCLYVSMFLSVILWGCAVWWWLRWWWWGGLVASYGVLGVRGSLLGGVSRGSSGVVGPLEFFICCLSSTMVRSSFSLASRSRLSSSWSSSRSSSARSSLLRSSNS